MRVPRNADARATARCEVVVDAVQVDGAPGSADCVEDGDSSADEVLVAVLFEPVQRRACRARAVEARSAHDDHLVGGVENSARCRLEHACAGIEADEVVVAFEQLDRPPELVLTERLRDPRVVVGRDDFETTGGLRRVAANVGVPGDAVDVLEQRPTVELVSRRMRCPSVPASGLPSSAITRSPLSAAKV